MAEEFGFAPSLGRRQSQRRLSKLSSELGRAQELFSPHNVFWEPTFDLREDVVPKNTHWIYTIDHHPSFLSFSRGVDLRRQIQGSQMNQQFAEEISISHVRLRMIAKRPQNISALGTTQLLGLCKDMNHRPDKR